ncbi:MULTISPECIES: hypothetical protein [Sorangium]|uniref:hypothetical protein n=1 Tax=Sorangium TaxID=39643 RepID=UPI00101AA565|nr:MULTISPECIES: hypothetical protein [Sorangium]
MHGDPPQGKAEVRTHIVNAHIFHVNEDLFIRGQARHRRRPMAGKSSSGAARQEDGRRVTVLFDVDSNFWIEARLAPVRFI